MKHHPKTDNFKQLHGIKSLKNEVIKFCSTAVVLYGNITKITKQGYLSSENRKEKFTCSAQAADICLSTDILLNLCQKTTPST